MRKWKLIPKIRYVNFRKEYPNMGHDCFMEWFRIERFWSRRIIDVCVLHHMLSFDFRRSWVSDMINPKGET